MWVFTGKLAFFEHSSVNSAWHKREISAALAGNSLLTEQGIIADDNREHPDANSECRTVEQGSFCGSGISARRPRDRQAQRVA